MGSWSYSSSILNLGTACRRMVSFMALLLYFRETVPGTHRIRGKEKICSLLGIEPRPLGRPAPSLAAHSLWLLLPQEKQAFSFLEIVIDVYILSSHSYNQ